MTFQVLLPAVKTSRKLLSGYMDLLILDQVAGKPGTGPDIIDRNCVEIILRMSSNDLPASNRSRICHTMIRVPFMQGRPWQTFGSTEIFSIQSRRFYWKQESKTMATELATVEGMQFDRGYLSPYFVSAAERMEVVLEDPYIPIHKKKISNKKGLPPVLERIARAVRPLLSIAGEVWCTNC